MTPYHEDERLVLYHADCLDAMRQLAEASVDAVVTDPPYDLLSTSRKGSRRINNPDNPYGRAGKGFMGKTWDGTGVAFEPATWAEAYRLLKPGGHLLAFGGTRTYHRLAVAIEDAGFEIRDCLVWGYASGFPKSLDVGKAIDRAAGAEREVVGEGRPVKRMIPGADQDRTGSWVKDNGREYVPTETEPATPDAARWDGWGTALKPAWEPIVMARKPLAGTVAANVLEHGTGALNIDATRIGTEGGGTKCPDFPGPCSGHTGHGRYAPTVHVQPRPTDDAGGASWTRGEHVPFHYEGAGSGRWPANVVLTDPIFDGGVEGVVGGTSEQVGGGNPPQRFSDGSDTPVYGDGWPTGPTGKVPVDNAGAYSRFFLLPKADRSDREPLVAGGLPTERAAGFQPTVPVCSCGERWRMPQAGGPLRCGHPPGMWHYEPAPRLPRENTHPTVKPVELMRHLVRLVTPPGGVVLDPFLGSGSTAIAAGMEGFRCVGVEKEEEYCRIAVARLAGQPLGLGL